MKVIHLISGGDVGGAKTHIETLLPKLNSIGQDASLLCVMEGAMTDECRRLGIRVKVISQKSRWDLTVVKKMANWLNEERFDIIHCHGARANFIAFFLRLFVKTPMLTTLHSDYMLDFTGYRRLLYTPLNVISLKRFKHFITVSEVFKQMLAERGFNASRIHVIHNGVEISETDDNNPVAPNAIREEFLSKYNIAVNADTVIIGCVARLVRVKGVDILLEASRLLFERGDLNAMVLIAGDGAEKANLREYIESNNLSEKVKLLGFVNDTQTFYAIADVNVLASRSEGIPLTLLEGARARLSTIASNTGGVPEVITHGKTGLLFNPGDYEALARLLKNEIENPAEGKKRGESFYNDVRERFSLLHTARRHVDVYNEIVEKN